MFGKRVQTMTPRTASDQFFTGRLEIVDARSQSEWGRARVPGALHISVTQVVRRLDEVHTDRPVAFLSRSGHRSSLAARRVAARRNDVSTVAGGIRAWLAAGPPVARCAPPQPSRR